MNAIVLCFLLFQNADYTPAANASAEASRREIQLREATVLHIRDSNEVSAKAYAIARDEEFVGKFNKLIAKLMDFAESYRNKQAIDVKKAKDIRKAWLELEKAEALFREDPKKLVRPSTNCSPATGSSESFKKQGVLVFQRVDGMRSSPPQWK